MYRIQYRILVTSTGYLNIYFRSILSRYHNKNALKQRQWNTERNINEIIALYQLLLCVDDDTNQKFYSKEVSTSLVEAF